LSTYIIAVAIAVPFFMLLISIEWIVSIRRGIIVNNPADMISSLSSGLTNILKDGLKISIALISYSWLVDYISIFKFESLIISVIIAFIVKDFAGYWLHRMDHRVNILWNRHLIHHSSEEFNLACALRQSISGIISFGAIFMIPAALFGVPAWLFAILGPIHLFMQFWYHTRLINKMGVLEHILVTPSHHRVHHAINPEYLDKNFSQIFIIWDKIFGTFQEELTAIPPVYGILRPAKTWNPIRINFKHFFSLLKDALQTKNWIEKIKLWFMPTGYRPSDIAILYPINTIKNPNELIKYKTENSLFVIIWGYLQLPISLLMIFHLFSVENKFEPIWIYLYAGIIMANIFSFTSLLDKNKVVILSELIKLSLIGIVLWKLDFHWFNFSLPITFVFLGFQLISIFISFTLLKITNIKK
jgi:alkylglycerol monooxygenase